MDDISTANAKGRLDDLIERAAKGEVVRIIDARHGAVRLVPDEPLKRPKRMPGRWAGRISIPDEKLLEPLSDDELAWLSGEQSK
jgi:antitoxin (DNA-binding transcriptional repressor) of toxin-antitoxin stability system